MKHFRTLLLSTVFAFSVNGTASATGCHNCEEQPQEPSNSTISIAAPTAIIDQTAKQNLNGAQTFKGEQEFNGAQTFKGEQEFNGTQTVTQKPVNTFTPENTVNTATTVSPVITTTTKGGDADANAELDAKLTQNQGSLTATQNQGSLTGTQTQGPVTATTGASTSSTAPITVSNPNSNAYNNSYTNKTLVQAPVAAAAPIVNVVNECLAVTGTSVSVGGGLGFGGNVGVGVSNTESEYNTVCGAVKSAFNFLALAQTAPNSADAKKKEQLAIQTLKAALPEVGTGLDAAVNAVKAYVAAGHTKVPQSSLDFNGMPALEEETPATVIVIQQAAPVVLPAPAVCETPKKATKHAVKHKKMKTC
jgi:hypothetical protein